MKKKRTSWILLLVWMMVIFFFSSQTGTESSGISNGILIQLENLLHIPLTSEFSSLIIRKLAHFTEYAILGVLIVQVVNQYPNLKKSKAKLFYCILFCLLYAMTDEFHQLFVSGRSGQLLDVLIDTCGGVFGIVCYHIAQKIGKKHV